MLVQSLCFCVPGACLTVQRAVIRLESVPARCPHSQLLSCYYSRSCSDSYVSSHCVSVACSGMVQTRSAEVMCTHMFAGLFTHRYQLLRLQQLPHQLPLQEPLRVNQDSGRAAHGVFCSSAAAATNDTDLDTLVLYL